MAHVSNDILTHNDTTKIRKIVLPSVGVVDVVDVVGVLVDVEFDIAVVVVVVAEIINKILDIHRTL